MRCENEKADCAGKAIELDSALTGIEYWRNRAKTAENKLRENEWEGRFRRLNYNACLIRGMLDEAIKENARDLR